MTAPDDQPGIEREHEQLERLLTGLTLNGEYALAAAVGLTVGNVRKWRERGARDVAPWMRRRMLEELTPRRSARHGKKRRR